MLASRTPRILLVNPWATDFSAFDLWSRPLGLLQLAGVARALGGEPVLLDCLDRHHWSLGERPFKPRRFSCGKYPTHEIPKPAALRWVPRKFKRYGISVEVFRESLDRIGEPDLVLVGSRMTHWYPGAAAAIAILRERFPRAPLILGGVYPSLFPAHAARYSGADRLVAGEGENALAPLLADVTKPALAPRRFDLAHLDSLPEPAYDLLTARDCLPFLISRGCPHGCSYCASRKLFGPYRRGDPLRAADRLIETLERFGFEDVAFYDDALLAAAPEHFVPFAERLIGAGVKARFHTPNGVDWAALDEGVAQRMARLGFETLRLSLETADSARLARMGRPSDLSRFATALRVLAGAGFDLQRVGVYILFGLPGQTRGEVEQSIDHVLALGAAPKLGEFSPLPFTAEWEKVRALGDPPLEQEPLLTNNSIFYRLNPEFPDSWVNELRHRIREACPPRGPDDDDP